MAFDVDLRREKYSQIARYILHRNKLKHPDVSLRNSAVHHSRVPKEDQVLNLGTDVLHAIEDWIKAAEQIVGEDYQRLWDARERNQHLPQDMSKFDRSLFDLRVSYEMLTASYTDLMNG